MSLAETYRRAERYANGSCPIEAGVMGRLADRECKHGRLPGDKGENCGCWPTPPNPVKRRRLMLGYTRARLAAEAGLNPTTIYRVENGERPIWSTISRLAFALSCDPEWLFPDEPRTGKPDFSVPTKYPEAKARAFELHAEGLSSVEVAREVRVSQATVARWLRGGR